MDAHVIQSISRCMYTHQHTCVHTNIPVYTSTYLYTHKHTCIHFNIPVYTSTYMYTHKHTCIHFNINVYTSTALHVHVCIDKCANTCIHTTHAADAYWKAQIFSYMYTHIVCARGGGLGSRPKKMYGKRLGDGVEYHLMSPTPRR